MSHVLHLILLKMVLSCQQGCYAAKNTSGMQPTARKQNYPNRLNRF